MTSWWVVGGKSKNPIKLSSHRTQYSDSQGEDRFFRLRNRSITKSKIYAYRVQQGWKNTTSLGTLSWYEPVENVEEIGRGEGSSISFVGVK